MSIRSPGDSPVGTIRDLRLPGRAVTALTRAGVTRIEDLAALDRRELAAITGLGPGMIAAIRLVVPEPPRSVVRSRAAPDADQPELAVMASGPEREQADDESPAAPRIPSFDSLRAPRRRTAFDLLVPGPPPVPSETVPPPSGVPRPAEYADLLHFAVRVAGAGAGVPRRVAQWWLREPVRCLRRLLGA
jgi:hypothetical protein